MIMDLKGWEDKGTSGICVIDGTNCGCVFMVVFCSGQRKKKKRFGVIHFYIWWDPVLFGLNDTTFTKYGFGYEPIR